MILQALSELRPNCNVEVRYNDDGSYTILNYEHSEPQPTEKELNDKVAELQADYDAIQYQRDRAKAYPDLAEQFDLLWHAIDGGKFNVKSKDTDFYKKLKAVKDANPKPE